MNNDQRIAQLERQVQELLDWKNQRMKQQLTFPLDKISTDIVQKDLLIPQKRIYYTRPDGIIYPFVLPCKRNGSYEYLVIQPDLHVYTVDTTSNVFTSPNHGFVDDDQVAFISSDFVPGGLLEGMNYFIESATTDTFKVSATSGGSAIDITSTGGGVQYVYFF